MQEVLANRLLTKVTRLIADPTPGLDTRISRKQDMTLLDLATPPAADYSISLYIDLPEIAATPASRGSDSYFWYWPFEEADYSS